MRLYVLDERGSYFSMIRQIKQVPKALHPCDRAQSCSFDQLGSIHDIHELANNRCDIVETTTLISVANEL